MTRFSTLMVDDLGFGTLVLRSQAQMLERGRPLPAKSANAHGSVMNPFSVSDPVPLMSWYAPGSADPRTVRGPFPASERGGVPTVATRTHRHMADAVELRGVNGTRMIQQHDPRTWSPGVRNKMRQSDSPAKNLHELRDRSRLRGIVENEMNEGGAMIVSRVTTSPWQSGYGGAGYGWERTANTPGALAKTSVLRSVAGSGFPLAMTPAWAGSESIVQPTPAFGSGIPLAVGTDTAGAPPSSDPTVYTPAPAEPAALSAAPPQGEQFSVEQMMAAFPGWGKSSVPYGTVKTNGDAGGTTATLVVPEKKSVGGAVLVAAGIGLFLLLRKKKRAA